MTIGIIGAAGYTGGELLRILLQHPEAEIIFAHSSSNGGKPLYSVHRDLLGQTDLCFAHEWHDEIDALFLCMGHGQAKTWLANNPVAARVRIIDLSNDFRLAANRQFGDRTFVYGLPEWQREAIRSAQNVANPGCFATAIQLSLLPLSAEGRLSVAHVSGITGSTGAGQALQESVHFTWRNNNIQAYKALSHQHVGEVQETLRTGSREAKVFFVPYRGDFTRGIYATAYTETDLSLAEAKALFRDYYANHPFTHLSDDPIDLKQVVGTNKCLLYLEKQDDQMLVHSVIDNLTKGASGQAVQNFNLMFGLEETLGLNLRATGY